MTDGTKHRLRLGVAGALLLAGVGFVVVGRGEDDLRAAARVIGRWDDRKATLRLPKPEEIAALPGETRALYLSMQNKEGGDTMNRSNDYADQAAWIRSLADERASHRQTGTALMALAVAWFGLSLWLAKTERRKAAAFE